MLRTWRESCDRIKPGNTQTDTSETASVMSTTKNEVEPRKHKSDDPTLQKI